MRGLEPVARGIKPLARADKNGPDPREASRAGAGPRERGKVVSSVVFRHLGERIVVVLDLDVEGVVLDHLLE
ncbi:MAG TPA: hypothetical protein VL400_03755, partial [Polyangiaceae bacterium]|nr:hypothetical protein [Polyangiaceae bacterium]